MKHRAMKMKKRLETLETPTKSLKILQASLRISNFMVYSTGNFGFSDSNPEMLSMDIHGARPFQLTEVMIFQVERRSTNSEKLETWEYYT